MDSLPPSFHHAFENVKYYTKDIISVISSCVWQPDSKLKINGRLFKIVKVLGEGGFSFVYLAQDEASGKEFALKKIRCTGADSVELVMREVAAYRRFKCVLNTLVYVYQLHSHISDTLILSDYMTRRCCKTLTARARSCTSSSPSTSAETYKTQ